MKTLEMWIVAKFWFLWITNALVAGCILCVFLSGLVSGRVGSHNIIPWCGILILASAVVGGSLWQRSLGHTTIATIPLLVFLVPLVVTMVGALLFGGFYFLLMMCGNGRMN